MIFQKMYPSLCRCNQHVSKIFVRNSISVPKDVSLYEGGPPGLTRFIGFFGICQWAVMSYMSYVLYETMPAFFSWIPKESSAKTTGSSNRLPLADQKYRLGFALFGFASSTAILFTTFAMSFRTVSSLILLRNSNKVLFTTYTPVGTKRDFIESMKNISAVQTRDTPMSQIPLKIKGKYFHFLLDKSGKFPQPTLYDRTIGIKRDFE